MSFSKYARENSDNKLKFNGDPNFFPTFIRNVNLDITKHGKDVCRVASRLIDPTCYLDADGNDALPPELIRIDPPAVNLPGPDADESKLATYSIVMDKYKKHNEDLAKIESVINNALMNNMTEGIIRSIDWNKTSSRDIAKMLHQTYGIETRNTWTISKAILEFIALKMDDGDTFENFYFSKFQEAKNLACASDSLALAILTSRANYNKHGIQCLPDRYIEGIEDAMRNGDDTIEKFRAQMRRFEVRKSNPVETGKSSGNDKKKANVIRKDHTKSDSNCDPKLRCINCYNTGHTSETCNLRACSGCQTWYPDHKRHNCPNVGKKNYSKRSFKRERHDDSDDNDENSSQSSKSTQNSSKSKSSYKKNFGNNKNNNKGNNNKRPPTPIKRSKKEGKDSLDVSDLSDESGNESDDETDESETSHEGNDDQFPSRSLVRFKPELCNEVFNFELGQAEGNLVSKVYSNYAKNFHPPRVCRAYPMDVMCGECSPDTSFDDAQSDASVDDVEEPVLVRTRKVTQGVPRNKNEEKKFLKVRRVYATSKNLSVQTDESVSTTFLMDTGAETTVVNDEAVLTEIVQDTDLPVIHAANGTEMAVTAVGHINEFIQNVHVCPDVTENLLSGDALLKSDHYILLTPRSYTDEGIAGYVLNLKHEIVLNIKNNMTVDISQYGQGVKEIIEISDYPHYCHPENEFTTIVQAFRVYGTSADVTVKELVRQMHNLGHIPKDRLCFMAQSILNFPVTPEQINRYFDHNCPQCKMGKMRKRSFRKTAEKKVTLALEDSSAELDKSSKPVAKPLPNVEDLVPLNHLEPRNLQIGAQIGIDYQGPILGLSTINFTDKASGYTIANVLGKDGKKDISTAFESTISLYAKYGHHKDAWNEPIIEFRMDSDPTFVSKKIKKVCENRCINATFSPPDQHEINGLAENKNQMLADMVTCMYAGAPYVPEQLWGVAWLLAVMVSNLLPSRVPNSNVTRQEEFTGIKPDFNVTPFLPFGTVVQYHLAKEQRGKFKFSPKAAVGIYLMPSLRVAGAISVFSFATKRIVDRRTYSIVANVPPAWTSISPKYFIFKGSDDELVALNAEEEENENRELLQGEERQSKLKTVETATTEPIVTPPVVTKAPMPNVDPPVLHSTVPLPTPPLEDAALGIISGEAHQETVMPSAGTPVEEGVSVEVPSIIPSAGTPVQEGVSVTAPPIPVQEGEHSEVAIPHMVQEGENTAPTVIERSEPIAAQPTRKSTRGKIPNSRYKNHRVFSPILEGLQMSMDNLLKVQYAKNIQDVPLKMMKVSGKRIKIVDVYSNCAEKHRAKILEAVRQVTKKKQKKRSKDNPSLQQAKMRQDWHMFQKAMDDELKQLRADHVYDEVQLNHIEKGIIPIGTMWVLTVKRNTDGTIDKYKARLVALGNQQKEDQYDKIKSPTARSSTVKMLISIQAKTKAKSCVLDVKGAYLKSKIYDEKLYIRFPDGKYGRLKKYLYGLKQAGYQWNETLADVLIKSGYKRSVHDPCVFSLRKGEKDFVIMTTHVDDFYVIASHQNKIDKLHEQLTKAFGEVTIKNDNVMGYLGMKVERKRNEVFVSQPGYVDKILEKADIPKHKTAKTPFVEGMSEKNDDDQPVNKTEYLEHIGMLNYLAVLTRPDILYALSRCAQQCSNPTKRDMRRVKKIFQYLNATKEHGLTFGATSDLQLNCWVDASHAQYPDGKGHYGYAFSFGDDDGVFYARSQKLKIVTPGGSTETEYVAMYEAATEIVFLRNLLNEIGFEQKGPTIMYEDNKSTIDLANGLGKFHKQKHVNVKYHYTKDLVNDKTIQVCYCPTEEMIADILTKPLSTLPHRYLASRILNVNEEVSEWKKA